MRYVFFGPPASGKGTQSHRLAGEKELCYLSTGGFLRSEISQNSEAGQIAKRYLDHGLYVPDEFILPMVKKWCDQQERGWVLDGFPRTLRQTLTMLEMMPFTHAIALEVDYVELERRVTGRLECSACHYAASRDTINDGESCPQCTGTMLPRADDDLENFRSRYEQFQALTVPAINHLEEIGQLTRVSGQAPPHEVFASVMRALDSDFCNCY